MRALLAVSTALFLAACSGATATPTPSGKSGAAAPTALAGDPAHPVVVELYQSQGCSSCPPADKVVNKLADRADVIPLSFAVTYWDDLGWKDIFGSPAYTARQWDYARAAGRAQVATPQVIVNGRDAVLGSREGELNAAIARNVVKTGPAITAANGKVTVGAGQATNATVWVVRYDPRTIEVAIKAGENGGATIPHRNIVKQLVNVGSWSGKSASYTLPAAPAGLKTAILVQNGKGGPILSAAKI
ncbi:MULTISPECIES: DUF1223 domain-containing protein [Sphingomonas]|uniref:DUF1223 domain-containing protein n=1 Tax=Sphingomonas TaxID=13687 RepID=UPI00083554C2|nr:DUF1223 domain-containing protein [Sphingomonas sp. CCH10-B3]MBA3880964.1 DUF1223 domain-containing protein [Sphingobium sp.]